MSVISSTKISPRQPLEESIGTSTSIKYGSSVPCPIYPSRRKQARLEEDTWKYPCQSLKTETFRNEARKDSLYAKQLCTEFCLTRTLSSSKESSSSFGDSSDEGSMVEAELKIRSSTVARDYSFGDGEDLDIEEQEFFDFSSVSTSSSGTRRVSHRKNRSLENGGVDVDEGSGKDEDVEKRYFVPPHLLVQRDTQSLFERPCSKRMINWT